MDSHQPEQFRFATIGNALTAARLVLLPVIVVGISTGQGWLTVAGMAAALATDLLDGRVARYMKQASTFGRTLDSTVDFVLIYSLFIAFYAAGRLATYQFAVIYVAMLTSLVMQLCSFGAKAEDGIVRTKLGKLTGALQYLYLLFLVTREVLPDVSIVYHANLGLFAALAAAVVLSSTEAIIRVRRLA